MLQIQIFFHLYIHNAIFYVMYVFLSDPVNHLQKFWKKLKAARGVGPFCIGCNPYEMSLLIRPDFGFPKSIPDLGSGREQVPPADKKELMLLTIEELASIIIQNPLFHKNYRSVSDSLGGGCSFFMNCATFLFNEVHWKQKQSDARSECCQISRT